MLPPPPRSTLFPYTTLFRSMPGAAIDDSPIRAGELRTASNWSPANSDNRYQGIQRASEGDRKSTRLNSSHLVISYAVFCLKKKKKEKKRKNNKNKKRNNMRQ